MLQMAWAGILRDAVPETATGAWSARAIVTQDGMFDIPHDRQDFHGDPDILDALTNRFPLTELKDTIRELLVCGDMSTRKQETFILFQDDVLTVVADTNASAGYCYIGAWVVPG
jgi:hypothetical protein